MHSCCPAEAHRAQLHHVLLGRPPSHKGRHHASHGHEESRTNFTGSLASRLTIRGFGSAGVAMPDLPPSLRQLVLEGPDGGIGGDRLPPFGLRLRNLTRLETLSLLGCASRGLAARYLGPCDGSPLPAGLRTLRLVAPTVVCWGTGITGSAIPADCAVTTSVECIEIQLPVGEDGRARGAMPYGSADQLVRRGAGQTPSQLSADDGTLREPNQLSACNGTLSVELSGRIRIERDPVAGDPRGHPCVAYAEQKICEIFSTAPGTYREVRVSKGDGWYNTRKPLEVSLWWTLAPDTAYRCSIPLWGFGMAGFADALMQYASVNGKRVRVSLSADERCCSIAGRT